MKKLFSASFILLLLATISAQEITSEIKMMFKNDDITNFKKVISHEMINKCYSIENSSYSLLALSIKMDRPKIFNKLIEEKANLHLICDDKSPLMYAAKYGNADFTQKLLEKGVDKNQKSAKGNTALYYANKYSHSEIIKMLQ